MRQNSLNILQHLIAYSAPVRDALDRGIGDRMSTFVNLRLHIVLGRRGEMSGFIRFTQHIAFTDRGHRECEGKTDGAHVEMMIHCSNYFQQLQR
jgi:hypothetical protein